MQLTDILIHLEQKIDITEEENLVEQLRDIEGVVAPRFNRKHTHLLLVAYNSDVTNSLQLLNKVNDNGYKAQLVGL